MRNGEKHGGFRIELDKGFFSVDIQGRENPSSDDYWDGNWLLSSIYAMHNDIEISCNISLRTDELQYLTEELVRFKGGDIDCIRVGTMEEELCLSFASDETGDIAIEIELFCPENVQSRQCVRSRFARSDINKLICDLSAIMVVYPVIGSRL